MEFRYSRILRSTGKMNYRRGGMNMKKILLILVTALLALSSCQRETPVEKVRTYALSSLRFDIAIDRIETKGIKSGWESGDKVFVFFSGVPGAYVTMTFDGTGWSSSPSNAAVSLSETGKLTAVYLPYVGNVEPAYSEGWHFPAVSESYFFKAEKVDYSIRDVANQEATLCAALAMTKANDASAQFFVPKTPEQNETMKLACSEATPTGLAAIASDGTVTSSFGTQGAWMTGYPATVDGEEGFYFYGMIAETPGPDTYFALKDNNDTYYKHYYKGNKTLISRRSYQLPDFSDWPGVGEHAPANVAGYLWYSLSDGASSPLETGTPSGVQPQAAGQKLIPSKSAWEGLLDAEKATRVPLTIGGVPGVLMVDKLIPSQYFFMTEGDYWSSASGFYFRVASGGTCSVESGTPESAYVRRILSVTSGGLTDPIDGGEI